MLLDGHRLIEEALEAGVAITEVLAAGDAADARGAALVARLKASGARVHAATSRVIQAAAQVDTSQGIVAIARRIPPASNAVLAARDLFLLIADQVADPGNLGTIMRTALAAGATAIAITTGSVDPFNPKVLRATMGAAFRLPVLSMDAASLAGVLSARGVHVLVADAHGSVDYREAPVARPVAIVVGSEARGPDPVWSDAGVTVRIPLLGPVESLNVAAAAALLLYEVARRTHA